MEGWKGFRPLDGESISKLILYNRHLAIVIQSFRPLDGESISKLVQPWRILIMDSASKFPSPRRGINF